MANINAFIPPGSTSAYAAPIEDAHLNIEHRLSNPNTVNKRILEEQNNARIMEALRAEFATIDTNADGNISKQELANFFISLY